MVCAMVTSLHTVKRSRTAATIPPNSLVLPPSVVMNMDDGPADVPFVEVCMYVCMYVYVHICMHIYVYTICYAV